LGFASRSSSRRRGKIIFGFCGIGNDSDARWKNVGSFNTVLLDGIIENTDLPGKFTRRDDTE
jgi:hypothetical protein